MSEQNGTSQSLNSLLRAARRQRLWTLEKAAEKVGVSVQTYCRWELGKQKARMSSLEQLCAAFGMPPEELGFDHVTHTGNSITVCHVTLHITYSEVVSVESLSGSVF